MVLENNDSHSMKKTLEMKIEPKNPPLLNPTIRQNISVAWIVSMLLLCSCGATSAISVSPEDETAETNTDDAKSSFDPNAWDRCYPDSIVGHDTHGLSAGERDCYFIEKEPSSEPKANRVRIAWKKGEGFYFLDDYEIHTDGIIEIEYINNTTEEQELSPSFLSCWDTHVHIIGVNDDAPHRWSSTINPNVYALKPGKVVRVRIDFRTNGGSMMWGGGDLWSLKDGCYDARIIPFGMGVKGNLRLCYTGAIKARETGPKYGTCGDLNEPMLKSFRDERTLSEIEWPFDVPIEKLKSLEISDDTRRTPIIWASAQGDLALVKNLLERGAKVEARGADGTTALAEALKIERLDIANLLLENGAIIHPHLFDDVAAVSGPKMIPFMIENMPEEYRDSALAHAVKFGEISFIQSLLEGGIDANQSSRYGRNPLETGILAGRQDAVKLLLQHEAVVLTEHLAQAARNGKSEIAGMLVASGFDPNLRDWDENNLESNWLGDTAMTKVANASSSEPMKLLMGLGADLATEGRSGMTPLNVAAESCSHQNVRFILSKLKKVKQEHLDKAMAYAAANRCYLTTEYLLDRGADASSKWGQAALIDISKMGGYNTVRLLLKHGVKVNKRAPSLQLLSSVHFVKWAVKDKEPEEREAILNQYKNNLDRGTTAILSSIFANTENIPTMKLLLEAGADVQVVDHKGRSPLQIAADDCILEQVEMLIGAGADAKSADTEGDTPLIKSIKSDRCYDEERGWGQRHLPRRRVEIVRLLLEAGAEKKARDKEGLTALDHAKKLKQEHLYELLK